MSKDIVTRTGTFRGKASDWGVSLTSEKKVPQFVFDVQLTEYWDEDEGQWLDYADQNEHITAYLTMFSSEGKLLKNTEQIMKVFGWDGESFTRLAEGDYSDVEFQVRIRDNDYEGATVPYQVAWLDEYDATPGRSINKLDAKGLKDLDKTMATVLKKNVSGSKPKSAPTNPKDKAKTEVTTEKTDDGLPDKEFVDGKETAASKQRRNAAQRKIDEKKAADRAAKKEGKSMPAIGGKKTEPQAEETLALTKDEAWERICATQEQMGKDCTDEKVNDALIEACQTVGESEEPDVDSFTNEQWGQVTELTIQSLVGV